jgi:uncharacterized repeat protein (TIGR03803 family)
VLYTFTGGTSGYFPQANLILVGGNLYSTTSGFNGNTSYGTVFKVTKGGKETLLYSFTGGTDGAYPQAGLVADPQGNLYGTTIEGGAYGWGAVIEVTTVGKETVLYSFTGKTDGAYPQGSLVRDWKGNLYGATPYGGSSAGSPSCGSGIGCGTVFGLTPAGKEIVLYNFTGGVDGGYPYAGLISLGGNLYGVTYGGGTYGVGAVFKVTLAGKETVLHSFAGGATDGESPEGTLVRDSKGNLYGVTFQGGSASNCYFGCGTVYELTPAGVLTVLYSFTGGTDGESPFTALVRDTAGNLYGTTPYRGSSNCPFGCGTVYEGDPGGRGNRALTLQRWSGRGSARGGFGAGRVGKS